MFRKNHPLHLSSPARDSSEPGDGSLRNVFDLESFRAKRSSFAACASSSSDSLRPRLGANLSEEELDQRVQRIKESIVRINALMSELKQMSDHPYQ